MNDGLLMRRVRQQTSLKGRPNRVQGVKKSILNLKGVLAPEVIAKHFKMPLEQILDILKQEN